MSSVTVIVLCPHARRQTVKASQNTSILEVLEEACRKQGINPEDYDISHYNKPLDLSLSIRFANLPNNAVLELNPTKRARQESSVTVCLQLESGERLTGEFSPSASMWDVIQKCSNEAELFQNEASGEPVCIYMRQQFTGEEIKKATLRSLGLTGGKAVIRLMYRPLETLTEQAHVSAPITKAVPFKNEVSEPTVRKLCTLPDHQSHKQRRLDTTSELEKQRYAEEEKITEASTIARSSEKEDASIEPMQLGNNSCIAEVPTMNNNTNNSIIEINANSEKDSELMECESYDNLEQHTEIGDIKYLGARNAVLFSLEDISEVGKVDLSDDFFELTIDDVQYLQNEYERKRKEMENEPLMLKSQRENRLLQKLATYQQTVIRIYFPDKLVLQGTFIAEETVQSVVEFVRNFLEDQNMNFYLYTAPPKTVLTLDKTLLQAKLIPAAVVYFGSESHRDSYLLPHIKTQTSDPRAASMAAAECRKKRVASENIKPVVYDQDPDQGTVARSDTDISLESNMQRFVPPTSDRKIPKWFKCSKK